MIEAILYGALGFFLAGLVAVLLVPALWNRAARITRRQLEDSLPLTSAEIQADKDRLRAEFATELRKLETELEKAKAKAVLELVETGKRRVHIGELEAELSELRTRLEETESAKNALDQTLSRGLPQMEEELEAAREAMAEIEKADEELRYRYGRDRDALRVAQMTVKRQTEDIRHLRAALETDNTPLRRFFGRSDSTLAKENRQLLARLSTLEEELAMARHYDSEDYLLREEMRKLSMQILRATQEEDTPLPELVPEEPPESVEFIRAGPNPADREAATKDTENPEVAVSEDKGSVADLEAAPDLGDERTGAAGPVDSEAKTATPGPESLSERLAARRGKTASSAVSR